MQAGRKRLRSFNAEWRLRTSRPQPLFAVISEPMSLFEMQVVSTVKRRKTNDAAQGDGSATATGTSNSRSQRARAMALISRARALLDQSNSRDGQPSNGDQADLDASASSGGGGGPDNLNGHYLLPIIAQLQWDDSLLDTIINEEGGLMDALAEALADAGDGDLTFDEINNTFEESVRDVQQQTGELETNHTTETAKLQQASAQACRSTQAFTPWTLIHCSKHGHSDDSIVLILIEFKCFQFIFSFCLFVNSQLFSI